MPGELGTGIAELCAQIKQRLCLLVLSTPATTSQGLFLARNLFERPFAVRDHIHKGSVCLWVGTGREGRSIHVLREMS